MRSPDDGDAYCMALTPVIKSEVFEAMSAQRGYAMALPAKPKSTAMPAIFGAATAPLPAQPTAAATKTSPTSPQALATPLCTTAKTPP